MGAEELFGYSEERLKEVIPNTPAFCLVKNYGSRDFLIYNEPEWLTNVRIEVSLPAMAEFILDDFIGTRWLDQDSESPLFLQRNPIPGRSYHKSWGRGTWIQDLGSFRYAPAYDALREVWLHDRNTNISWTALRALAKLRDDRTIDDLAVKLRRSDALEGYERMDNYLFALREFKTDKAVEIIMDFADVLRSLYKGRKLEGEGRIDREYNLSPMSDRLRTVMSTLSDIRTRKAIKALKDIKGWFPVDGMVYNAYKDISKFGFISRSDVNKCLVLPVGLNEGLAGSGDNDIPF